MKSRLGRWSAFFLGLAALALTGCGKPSGQPTSGAEGPAAEPYVIGALFALTGDASSLGIPERNTALMVEKMVNESGGINGHPLKIVVEDTRGEPSEAVNALQRLLAKNKPLAIIGPSRTGTTLAIVDLVEKHQLPMISCASGIEIVEPVKKWVFNTAPTDKRAVERIVDYLKAKGIKRVASLTDNSTYGKSGRREVATLLPAAGIEVLLQEEYGPKDASMEAQLTKIKASKAEAVICWGTPPGPGIVARNMKQLAMTIPLICGSGVANEKFISVAGEAGNGVVFPAARLIVRDQIPADHPQKEVLDEYAQRYQKAYNQSADHFGGHAWDATQLVIESLREVGPDSGKIRDHIEQTKGFIGTDGIFNYSATDHNGLSKDAFVMIEVVDGKWKLLE